MMLRPLLFFFDITTTSLYILFTEAFKSLQPVTFLLFVSTSLYVTVFHLFILFAP